MTNYALSTLMFTEKNINMCLDMGIQIEIFPMWHCDWFIEFVKKNKSALKEATFSFHESYYGCDHSVRAADNAYVFNLTTDFLKKDFELAQELSASYMVFHLNNRRVSESEKGEMLKIGLENLHLVNEIAQKHKIPVLVENTGVAPRGNVLLNQSEFIEIFAAIPNDCLFDIGHAHCNGWDIPHVIGQLGEKIKAYHINNNDATDDLHLRIGDETCTFDYSLFTEAYKKNTPCADIVFEYDEKVEVSRKNIGDDVVFLKMAL